MFSRYRRQVRRRVGEGLHSRLFIHRNRNDLHRGYPLRSRLILQGHFLIHQQDFPHLAFKSRIAALQIVGDLVRLQGLRRQYPMHGRLRGPGQGRVSGRHRFSADVLG